MSTIPEDRRRNVVPRLRSFITTLALGELDSPTTAVEIVDEQSLQSLERSIAMWRENQTVPFAADLVSSAFVLNKTNVVRDAAEFLLSPQSHAPDAAKVVATKILTPNEGSAIRRRIVSASGIIPSLADVHNSVHALRQKVKDEPRNALLWTELAREYVLLGLFDKAETAMDIAVSLGRHNRFVLRSAARLYLHIGKSDKGHYVLMRSEATRYDPWLLSAEIAMSSALERTSKNVSTGRRMLQDDSIFLFHKNELASAVGTLELCNGKLKSARDLFKTALAAPTENSVAQIEWAHRRQHIPGIDVDLDRMRAETPRSFEARAWDHFINARYQEAFDQSFQWFYDQPFSSRPVRFGSFVGCCVLEDFQNAEILIRYGLNANPKDRILLNNLAFMYASSGELRRAKAEFKKIQLDYVKEASDKIPITATEGLLAFRGGNPIAGRALYEQAISLAAEEKFRTSRALASIYLAREEALAQTENAEKALEIASREVNRLPSPDNAFCQLILQRVPNVQNVRSNEHTNSASRVGHQRGHGS